MSNFWQGATLSETPAIPRPTIIRDGPPPARQVSEEERDSWQSPYYRKSARLSASPRDPLPWPARVQMVNGIPLRYQKAYLDDMNKRIPKEEKELGVPKPVHLRNRNAQSIRRSTQSSSPYDGSHYDGSTFVASSRCTPRSYTHPSSQSDAYMFRPDASNSPALSPPTSGLDYLTRPRPGSTGSSLSRRHTEPSTSGGMSAQDQLALEQYAAELLSRTASRQSQPEIMPIQEQPRILDLREPARSTVAGTSISVPYGADQSVTSQMLSQARYGQPSVAPAGYGPKSAMSIANISQATSQRTRKPGEQRYEQWANHE